MCGHHHHRDAIEDRPGAVLTAKPDVRASAEDRDRVVAQLRLNTGAGRLDLAEFEERVDLVWQARTTGQLAEVVADLPFMEPPEERQRRQRLTQRALLVPYLSVMALLITIWALTTPGGYFWPIWPMLGWGIPVMAQLRGSMGRPRRSIPI